MEIENEIFSERNSEPLSILELCDLVLSQAIWFFEGDWNPGDDVDVDATFIERSALLAEAVLADAELKMKETSPSKN